MKTQKGITLIALIITIIVMLILVGVSVSVALNTGLFKAAQGAAKNTEAHRINETAISNGTVTVGNTTDSIENIVNSYKGGTTGGTTEVPDATDTHKLTIDIILDADNDLTVGTGTKIASYTYYAGPTTTWGELAEENEELEFTADGKLKIDGYYAMVPAWTVEGLYGNYYHCGEDFKVLECYSPSESVDLSWAYSDGSEAHGTNFYTYGIWLTNSAISAVCSTETTEYWERTEAHEDGNQLDPYQDFDGGARCATFTAL